MSLDAHIVRALGTFALDVELHARPGEVMALLGPNGAGKSTLLRCLAGLLALDAGHITLDGQCLDAPDSDRFVSPSSVPSRSCSRAISCFPASARSRMWRSGYARAVSPRQRRALAAAAWLERVGLTDHAHHRPGALSGGQAQRVALARALATEPRLLLLDEPLAALDAGARTDVRRDLRKHLATFGGVRLLVTHDPVDAYALADRVIILEGGAVAQSGTLADVTARPRSRYIADLIGVNLVSGVGGDGMLTTAAGGRSRPRGSRRGPRLRGHPAPCGRALSVAACRQPPQCLAGDRGGDRPSRGSRQGAGRRRGPPRRRDHPVGARGARTAPWRRDLGLGQSNRDHDVRRLTEQTASP